MAGGVRRLSPGPRPGDGRAWLGLAAGLALVALIGALLPVEPLLWRRDAPWQPWRWLTPVAVHWTPGHLAANVAACALLAWLGWSARLPRHAAAAWLLAWPLTHLGLWLDGPDSALQRYAGLSGVLHAGVAVAAAALLGRRAAGDRTLGTLLALGLTAKVLSETPWRGALVSMEGWSFPVAVSAHASGAAAGAAAAAFVAGCRWARRCRR